MYFWSPKFEVECFFCRAFDVELLMIAQQLGIPIAEVAVRWTEVEGEVLVRAPTVVNQ